MNEPMLSIILSASVLGGPEWDSKVRGVWDLDPMLSYCGRSETQGIPGRPFRMRLENAGSSSASRARLSM
jgi:hypothetical protein